MTIAICDDDALCLEQILVWTREYIEHSPYADTNVRSFTVPEDLCPVEVNAVKGCYIRARVLHVENEFSVTPRWIVPFVKSAECQWQYAAGRPAHNYRSRNNGETVELTDAREIESAQFPAIVSMAEAPRAMYFCFDKSRRTT